MKRTILLILIVVLFIFSFTFIISCTTKSKEIKIGVVLPLTGNAAVYGEWTKEGMDLASNIINQNSEVLKFDLVYEDSKSTPQGDVNAFQKLVSVDKVSVAVGFILSNGALACAPIANSSKVVLLSTSTSSDKFKDAGDYAFRLRESGTIHGIEMAKYARNFLNVKTAGLFYANAENGITYAGSFGEEFESLGGKIVFDERFTEKETDFRSTLSKLGDKDPDVVYLAGLAPDMGNILKQAKELGVETQWLASPGAENPKLIQLAKDAAEGLIFTTPAFNPNSNEENVKTFVTKYEKTYGESPGFLAANGYDGINVLADVIQKFGSSAENIKNGLYQVKNYPGVGGTFSFDKYGEVQKSVLFKKVQDGQFVAITLSRR
ncbi:MAG: ABC transporter substrate-binding protein [Nanoarchaeota archaeon]|nr:ABC transporter substrate-binding protein [Nanoarchaeota archaeon]